MSVNIIRKQSGQANEVTDAMLEAVGKMAKKHIDNGTIRPMPDLVAELRQAMEAARIAEVGEIERIDIIQKDSSRLGDMNIEITPDVEFITLEQREDNVVIDANNLIPLAEALLELGKQMKGAV